MSKKYKFLESIYYKVSNKDIRILLPEADIDDRVFEASVKLTLDNICKVSVIGDSKSLINKYNKIDKSLIEKIKIFDIESNNQVLIKFANKLYKKRKHKGLSQEKAYELMHNINYYACMLLDQDQVDGVVTGATFTTREVFKPALQIIGTKDIYHRISSYFIMNLNETTYFFADCAVNITPDSQTLSEIAIDTALTAKKMNIEPKVAFLSFSTNNSAIFSLI